MLLLQLEAHQLQNTMAPRLRTMCLGPGSMGMHVVSPIDRAVSLYHFRDVSLSFTGLRFFKRSSDSLGASFFFFLPFALKNLVKEFHLL